MHGQDITSTEFFRCLVIHGYGSGHKGSNMVACALGISYLVQRPFLI